MLLSSFVVRVDVWRRSQSGQERRQSQLEDRSWEGGEDDECDDEYDDDNEDDDDDDDDECDDDGRGKQQRQVSQGRLFISGRQIIHKPSASSHPLSHPDCFVTPLLSRVR